MCVISVFDQSRDYGILYWLLYVEFVEAILVCVSCFSASCGQDSVYSSGKPRVVCFFSKLLFLILFMMDTHRCITED